MLVGRLDPARQPSRSSPRTSSGLGGVARPGRADPRRGGAPPSRRTSSRPAGGASAALDLRDELGTSRFTMRPGGVGRRWNSPQDGRDGRASHRLAPRLAEVLDLGQDTGGVPTGSGREFQAVVHVVLGFDRCRRLRRCSGSGLCVVGRLASRHGIEVESFGGDHVEGVSALISVPSSALLEEDSARATLQGAWPTRWRRPEVCSRRWPGVAPSSSCRRPVQSMPGVGWGTCSWRSTPAGWRRRRTRRPEALTPG